MIPELVNLLNISLRKGIRSRIGYSSYRQKILQKLVSINCIVLEPYDNQYYLYFKVNNHVNRFFYLKPPKLSYSLTVLKGLHLRYKKFYNGTMLMNTTEGLTTEVVTGGQVVLYVY